MRIVDRVNAELTHSSVVDVARREQLELSGTADV